jgi:hypothetical protein
MRRSARRALWAAAIIMWVITAVCAADPHVPLRIFNITLAMTALTAYTAVQSSVMQRRVDRLYAQMLRTAVWRPDPPVTQAAPLRLVPRRPA